MPATILTIFCFWQLKESLVVLTFPQVWVSLSPFSRTFSLSIIFHSLPSSKSCYSYCVTLCFLHCLCFCFFSVYVVVVWCISVFVGARFFCVSVFPLFVCACYSIFACMWMCECKWICFLWQPFYHPSKIMNRP